MEESEELKPRPIIRLKRFRWGQLRIHDSKVEDGYSPFHPPDFSPSPGRIQRHSPEDDRRLNEQLWPIVKCYPDPPWPEPWSIYVLPMSFRQSQPSKGALNFIESLIGSVSGSQSLQSYTFFEQAVLYPNLISEFVYRAASFMALPGIGVRPEYGAPRLPTQADIEGLDQKRIMSLMERKKQDLGSQDFFPDLPPLIYWIKQNQQLAREVLMGEGGWSLILSTLEEKPFFEKLKGFLFEGVDDKALNSLPIVAPMLAINSFLSKAPRDLREWFGVLELYLGECPQEGGLVIASRTRLDEVLIELAERSGLRTQRTAPRR